MRRFSACLFTIIWMGATLAYGEDQCDFYAQKSAQLQCASDGYLETFGLKLCRTFLTKASRFSPSGQIALQNIRSCLIDALGTSPNVTCDNVKNVAVTSHVRCYIDSGFCSLKMSDRFKVYWYLRHETTEPEFQAAGFEIRRLCEFVFIKPTQL